MDLGLQGRRGGRRRPGRVAASPGSRKDGARGGRLRAALARAPDRWRRGRPDRGLAAVQLDDESGVRPEGIHFEAADSDVHLGQRNVVLLAELEEPDLRARSWCGRAAGRADRWRREGGAPRVAAGEDGADVVRGGEAEVRRSPRGRVGAARRGHVGEMSRRVRAGVVTGRPRWKTRSSCGGGGGWKGLVGRSGNPAR